MIKIRHKILAGFDEYLDSLVKKPWRFSVAGFSLSFNLYFIFRGIAIFIIVFFFIFIFTVVRVDSFLIKKITVKQASQIVAEKPVEWTVFVKRSDIKATQHFVKLPKTAKNIKITIVSAKEKSSAVLAKPKERVSLNQRVQLAMARSNQNIFKDIKSSFFANVGEAISDIVATPANDSSASQQVTQTLDATVVDLSNQLLPPADSPPANAAENSTIALEASTTAPAPAQSETPVDSSKESQAQTTEENPTLTEASGVAPSTTETKIETANENKTEVASEPAASSEKPLESLTPPEIKAEVPAPAVADTEVLAEDIASAQALLINGDAGVVGDVAQSDSDALQSAIESAVETENSPAVAQSDVDIAKDALSDAVATFEEKNQFVKIDYQTAAPQITEENTERGKMVKVFAENESVGLPMSDVLASTKIPKIFKTGEENKIHIKWKNNSNQEMTFKSYDTDNDGYLDYVEWTVPHLSEQTFEIIFDSKAFQLDASQNIVADIYDQVKEKDNNWATIYDGQYIRATFYQNLSNTSEGIIYVRPTDASQSASIEVYPVYTDASGNITEGELAATFSSIDHEDTYKILLANLKTSTNQLDFKAKGNVNIDWIDDSTVEGRYWINGSGNWSDTSHWSNLSGGSGGYSAPTSANEVYFDVNSGTGTVAVDVAATMSDFNHLKVGLTVAIGTNNFTVNGDSAVTNGIVTIGGVDAKNIWTTGNFTIGSGGTVEIKDSETAEIKVSGNWKSENGGVYKSGKSTVFMVGSGIQTFEPGISPFYNLTFDNTGTVQLKTDDLVIKNNFLINSGNFDNETNHKNVSITGDLIMNNSSGTTSMGDDALWTVGGNFSSYNVQKLVVNKSTLKMTVAAGQIMAKGDDSSAFYNLAIAKESSVTLNDISDSYYFSNQLTVDGTLVLGGSKSISLSAKKTADSPKTSIGSSGKITGVNGVFIPINEPSGLGSGVVNFAEGGVIDIKDLKIIKPSLGSVLTAGIYGCKTATVSGGGKFILGNGKHVFENVLITNGDGSDLTITTETSILNITVRGNLTFAIEGSKNIIIGKDVFKNTVTKGSFSQNISGKGSVVNGQ